MEMTGKAVFVGHELKTNQKSGNPYMLVRFAEESGKNFELMLKDKDKFPQVVNAKKYKEFEFIADIQQGQYPKFDFVSMKEAK